MWAYSDSCIGRLADEHERSVACTTHFATQANACQTTGAFSHLLLHERSRSLPCWDYCRPLPTPKLQAATSDTDRNIFKVCLSSSSPPPKRQCIDRMTDTKGLPLDGSTVSPWRDESNVACKPQDNYYLNDDQDELPDLASDDGSDEYTGMGAVKEHGVTAHVNVIVCLERLDDETASYCSSNSLVVGSAPLRDKVYVVSSDSGTDYSRKRQIMDCLVGGNKKTCAFRPVVSSHLSVSSQSSCSSRHFMDAFSRQSMSVVSGVQLSETARPNGCSSIRVDGRKKCLVKRPKQGTTGVAKMGSHFPLKRLKAIRVASKCESSSSVSDSVEQLEGVEKKATRDVTSRRYRSALTRNRSLDDDDAGDDDECGQCLNDLSVRHSCLATAPLHAITPPLNKITSYPFCDRHTEMVESCLDEGSTFLRNAVITLRDFTTARRYPSTTLMCRLLRKLLESTDISASYDVYNVLNEVCLQHATKPQELPFTWNYVKTAVTQLHLPLGVYGAPTPAVLSSALALQYMTNMMEDELFSRPITAQRQVMHSVAYRVLSAETQFSNVKLLLQWIADALHSGKYGEDGINSSSLVNLRIGTTTDPGGKDCGDVSGDAVTANEARVPKILPIMQRLLNLVMIVSRCPEDCAKRIAVHLKRIYMHLPTLYHRHLLVTSITSRLLRLKLAQRVLEDHCSDDDERCGGCNSGAICLGDIITCYFCCVPPQNLLTPPPTPERDDNDADGIDVDRRRYLPQSCEELSMLLYTVIDSYVANSRGTVLSHNVIFDHLRSNLFEESCTFVLGDIQTV